MFLLYLFFLVGNILVISTQIPALVCYVCAKNSENRFKNTYDATPLHSETL